MNSMNRKLLMLAMCVSAVLSLTGCTFGNNKTPVNKEPATPVTGQGITSDEDENDEPKLSLQINKSASTETDYSDLNVGDELYSGFNSTVKIKSVNEEKIVFALDGCLVEPNANGGIDLRGEPLKELTVKKGEEKILHSQTMDAGVKLTISYN